ncbi:N-acetylglucosamine-6-phosphate deacetylase [Corynebacterium auriscanis]|uniref:N-acetylglucosamine-6-phosphate deacetylase n=1 Tax=Corynebacterium auriscanis TaxID=99807 RepID=UPI003CF95479
MSQQQADARETKAETTDTAGTPATDTPATSAEATADAADYTQSESVEAPAPNGPRYDPIMVVAASGEKETSGGGQLDLAHATVAVWQVETDPAVQRGDFSGAWVVTPEGITGFAAQAEWIADRQDPLAMLRTLLRFPVLLAPGTPRAPFQKLLGQDVLLIDTDATTAATHQEFEQARKDFAQEAPGKRQPAWGEVPELSKFIAVAGQGDAAQTPATDADAAQPAPTQPATTQDPNPELPPVVRDALATARGLREWLILWNAFDKLRARRLGQTNSLHSEPKGAPLR